MNFDDNRISKEFDNVKPMIKRARKLKLNHKIVLPPLPPKHMSPQKMNAIIKQNK